MAQEIRDEETLQKLIQSKAVLLIKWGGTFCGPCKKIQPFFQQLAQKYERSVYSVYVEIDKHNFDEVGAEFQIQALPTFTVTGHGKLLDRLVGGHPEALEKLFVKFCGDQEK